MLHLNEQQVTKILYNTEKTLVQCMENVFVDFMTGNAEMIPKVYLTNDVGDFRAMPARWGHVSGIKWISVYPYNHTLNLPTIYGTLLLNDSYTGKPIVSMDCAKLTGYRTAAVSALAAKHLIIDRPVTTLSFIGCGYQARLHAEMYMAVFPDIKAVNLYDTNRRQASRFLGWLQDQYIGSSWGICESVHEACMGADIITTLTPSIEGFLGNSDIQHPVHINAIGADAKGKRELESSIWMQCDLVVDDYDQASHSGEAQHIKHLPYLTLGDIIIGKSKPDPNRSTVFDSTGLAIEDIAIGKFIYEQYCKGN